MENTKRKIVLDIAGSRIPLITDENEKYMEKLASVITQKVNSFALSGSGMSRTDAALMYALTLLDENCKLQLELSELKKANNGN